MTKTTAINVREKSREIAQRIRTSEEFKELVRVVNEYAVVSARADELRQKLLKLLIRIRVYVTTIAEREGVNARALMIMLMRTTKLSYLRDYNALLLRAQRYAKIAKESGIDIDALDVNILRRLRSKHVAQNDSFVEHKLSEVIAALLMRYGREGAIAKLREIIARLHEEK